MTLNEMVGILAERSSRSFDIPFQEEMKRLVVATGEKFTKDSLQKRPRDRNLYLQSFVAEVKHVSKIECPISYGCTLRTVEKIPTPIRGSGIIFDFVGSADFEVPYSLGGSWKEQFFKHNKFTSGKNRYEFRDGYLFIKDDENALEYVGVQGVFPDPTKLEKFKCKDGGGSCYSDDEEYPIPGDIKEAIIRHILGTVLRIPTAEENHEIKVDGKDH